MPAPAADAAAFVAQGGTVSDNCGGAITVQNFVQNEKDVRSFDMPRWMLMASMPLSFGMMAIEFARLLVRRESPYGAGLTQREE